MFVHDRLWDHGSGGRQSWPWSHLWKQVACAALAATTAQTVTCDPTSTARLVGIRKCWLTSLALRARPMKSLSCQLGISDCADGLSARRERKNDVRITSNFQPSARHAGSALGMFGVSMKPKRSVTREKPSESRSMDARSATPTRGVSSVVTLKMTFCWCSTLLCLRLCRSALGTLPGLPVRNT